MPTESITVDDVVALDPSRLLKQHGFQRRQRAFHRRRGELVDSIYFQSFRAGPQSFCVNLSIIVPFHHEVCRGLALPAHPSPVNTTTLLRARLSFPSPDGPTQWLFVSSLQPVAALAPLVARELEHSLSFFDSFVGIDDIIATLEEGKSDFLIGNATLDLAILHARQGRCERALSLLSALDPARVPPGVIERVRRHCA